MNCAPASAGRAPSIDPRVRQQGDRCSGTRHWRSDHRCHRVSRERDLRDRAAGHHLEPRFFVGPATSTFTLIGVVFFFFYRIDRARYAEITRGIERRQGAPMCPVSRSSLHGATRELRHRSLHQQPNVATANTAPAARKKRDSSPPTRPIGENNRYVNAIQVTRMIDVGTANRQGVMSTAGLSACGRGGVGCVRPIST